jgi:hypothetical protein
MDVSSGGGSWSIALNRTRLKSPFPANPVISMFPPPSLSPWAANPRLSRMTAIRPSPAQAEQVAPVPDHRRSKSGCVVLLVLKATAWLALGGSPAVVVTVRGRPNSVSVLICAPWVKLLKVMVSHTGLVRVNDGESDVGSGSRLPLSQAAPSAVSTPSAPRRAVLANMRPPSAAANGVD